jgi:uncharacterized membrane protein
MSKKGPTRDRRERSKREQFVAPRKRNRSIAFIVAAALVFFGITIYFTVGRSPVFPEAAAQSEAQLLPAGADVRLPVSTFDDGRAHFYRYVTSVGREIRLFAIRSSDGVIRAAFDACDVCYRQRKGYHQEGNDMVCNNCGRHFRSVDVNVITGGCNPTALQRTVDGSQVVLKTSDLDLGAAYF